MAYFLILVLLTEAVVLQAQPSIKHCKSSTPGIDWDCRRRALKGIPYDVFDDDAYVKLGNNPFNCDCSMVWFLREPDNLKKNIKDLQNLTCGYPTKFAKRKITSLKENEICPGAKVSRSRCRQFISARMLRCTPYSTKIIPYDVFETHWPKIQLAGMWTCDCNMVWFIRRLKNETLATKVAHIDHIQCSSVKLRYNRRFFYLTEQDVCPQKDPDFCSLKPCNETVSRCKAKKEFYTCKDIDECKEKRHSCRQHEDCVNVVNGYECECKEGRIRGEDGVTCIDYKACTKERKVCPANAECLKTTGFYKCHCKSGFTWQGPRCVDVNECKRKSHDCDKNAKCRNIAGGFTCKCKGGFHDMEKGRICVKKKADVDECDTDTHTCDRNAKCVNMIGGYKCRCNQGYDELKQGRICILKKDKVDLRTYAFIGASVVLFAISVAITVCLFRRKKKQEKNSPPSNKAAEETYYLEQQKQMQYDMMAMTPLLPGVGSEWSEYEREFAEQSPDEDMDYDHYQSLNSLR